MNSPARDVQPLDLEQTEQLKAAVSGLSRDQLQWLSGYAAGLAAVAGPTVQKSTEAVAPVGRAAPSMTILFGSQTGNGEAIAAELQRDAVASGYSAKAISLADYKPSSIKREKLLTFVVSTHGEGDPPDDAEIFREFLLSKKAPRLDGVKFAVLALGDSSYVNFCQTGREFDARLAELGAERLLEITECDLDFEARATPWVTELLSSLPPLDMAPDAATIPRLRAVENPAEYNSARPFPAEVLVNQKITGAQSSKDVRHIELSLEGSGMTYQPGDSLAVVAKNPPQLVAEFLQLLKANADDDVLVDGSVVQFQTALSEQFEITATSLVFLKAWAELAGDDELTALLNGDDRGPLAEFLDGHQIIDVVTKFPAAPTAQQFVDLLRRLRPRSYSISSSSAANPDEVHLTVAAVRYSAFGRPHWGAASTHLADQLAEGDVVDVYVEANTRFRLPAADVPIVMIGPGTGIAPFRAFLEERVEQGASGSNWLFFGDRNSSSDFLYQLEWQRHLKQGHLERLEVAFSRDQRHKIYVQDKMRSNGAELYEWIEAGAAIYVCGDAKHMAGDVHDALLDVISSHGGVDAAAAEERLRSLRAAGRYQRDVY